MTPKQNAPHHPKAMEGASDDKPHFTSASRTASGKRPKQAVQGLATPRLSGMRHRGGKLQAQRLDHLHDGGELWVAFGGQGFVESFAGQPSITRQLTHATGAGNITQRRTNQATIAGVFPKAGFKVQAHFLFGVDLIDNIPFAQFEGHGAGSLQLLRQFCPANTRLNTGLGYPIPQGFVPSVKHLGGLDAVHVSSVCHEIHCTPLAPRGTVRTGAEKRHGFSSPELEKAQQPRPPLDSGFLFAHVLRMAHGFIYGRPCWGIRKSAPVPFPGLLTRHGLPPTFSSVEAGFKPVEKELFMANPIPKGRIAPASLPNTGKPSPTFDPIAAHVEAVNALAMAKFYAKRHNHIGAARKAVQALSALRKLAAFERVEVAHA